MTTTRLDGVATTSRIDPGQETHDSSGIHVRGRVFTDRVESADVCLDGTNRVTLDLDLNLADGSGTLGGTFKPESPEQTGDLDWRGLGALRGEHGRGRRARAWRWFARWCSAARRFPAAGGASGPGAVRRAAGVFFGARPDAARA